MKWLIGSLFILISACATTKEIVGPDGTPHKLVDCRYAEDCYRRAREACEGNYKIANTTNQVSGGSRRFPSSTWTEMLVKCDAP